MYLYKDRIMHAVTFTDIYVRYIMHMYILYVRVHITYNAYIKSIN